MPPVIVATSVLPPLILPPQLAILHAVLVPMAVRSVPVRPPIVVLVLPDSQK